MPTVANSVKTSENTAILVLGSNLGNTTTNLAFAINCLNSGGCTVLSESEYLYSEPVGFASKNIFCNIALLIKTQFSPIKFLKFAKTIEKEMGRKTDTIIGEGYTDRVIDIDIVRFNNLVYECRSLSIPHRKHLDEREFSKILLNNLKSKNTI